MQNYDIFISFDNKNNYLVYISRLFLFMCRIWHLQLLIHASTHYFLAVLDEETAILAVCTYGAALQVVYSGELRAES